MKTFLLSLVLFFAFLQFTQAQPIPQDSTDIVWWKWTNDDINRVHFSPDGAYIIATDNGNAIAVLYNSLNGDTLKSINSIKDAMFSPDGKYIVGLFANNLVVVDVITWEKVQFDNSINTIGEIIFNNEGSQVIASMRETIGYIIWDFKTGKKITEKTYPELLINYDGLRYCGLVRFINNEQNILLYCYRSKSNGSNTTSYYSLLTIDVQSQVIISDSSSDAIPYRISHNNDILALNDTNWSQNTTALRIFDLNTKTILFTIPGYPQTVYDLAYSPDDKYLFVAQGTIINIWDIGNKNIIYTYSYGNTTQCLNISSNNQYLVTGNGPILELYKTPWYTSVIEPSELIKPRVYPNPSDNSFNLEFSTIKPFRVSISLTTLTGAIVKSIYLGLLQDGNHSFNIETTGLASGVYFVKVESNSILFSEKIIINK